MPAALCMEAAGLEVIQEISEAAGLLCDIDGIAAWKLVNFSATLSDVLGALRFEKRTAPNWDYRHFDSEALIFSRSNRNEKWRLAEYKHPVTQQYTHWLWNECMAAQVCRDWGRFAVLSNIG